MGDHECSCPLDPLVAGSPRSTPGYRQRTPPGRSLVAEPAAAAGRSPSRPASGVPFGPPPVGAFLDDPLERGPRAGCIASVPSHQTQVVQRQRAAKLGGTLVMPPSPSSPASVSRRAMGVPSSGVPPVWLTRIHRVRLLGVQLGIPVMARHSGAAPVSRAPDPARRVRRFSCNGPIRLIRSSR
jgi:hypothetical protein